MESKQYITFFFHRTIMNLPNENYLEHRTTTTTENTGIKQLPNTGM